MIIGKEKILDFLEKNDAPYWTLYPYEKTASSNTFLTRIEDKPGYDIKMSREKLSEYLDLLEPGRYRITMKRTYDVAKGFVDTAFTIPETVTAAKPTSQVSGLPSEINTNLPVQIGGAQFIPQSMVTQQLQEWQEKYEQKQSMIKKDERIKELENELKEFKKGSFEQTLTRVYDRIEPYLDKVMPKTNKPIAAQISGANNEALTDEQATDIMTSLIQEWEELRPGDSLEVIEKIVDLIKNDPSKYAMAKSFM